LLLKFTFLPGQTGILNSYYVHQVIKFHVPVNPGVSAAIFLAKSILSKLVFNGCRCTLKMDALPLMSGAGTKICRSNLPGRSKALSKMSTLFVAARTTTLVVVLKPGT